MFDYPESGIELSELEVLSGEREDQLAYQVTVDEMATGWTDDDRHVLPDLSAIPPGPYLGALLEHFDRKKLNGFDVVRLMQARERQLAHLQAGSMADAVETAYSAPGDSESDVSRLGEQFEYAADELRPALTLSRRAAEYRLSLATDIIERLPEVWDLLRPPQGADLRQRHLSSACRDRSDGGLSLGGRRPEADGWSATTAHTESWCCSRSGECGETGEDCPRRSSARH
jgi:hypothetical protein